MRVRTWLCHSVVKMWSAVVAFFLVYFPPSSTAGVQGGEGGYAGSCISGFMSLDRIHAVVGNYDSSAETFDINGQAIIPAINFTCSGSIQSWVFGAQWEGNSDSFTELQIWRPGSGDGSYTKVGSTTIMAEQSTTDLYEYRLSSPLPFQTGDVLGYYQAGGQLRFLFEEVDSGHPLHYYRAQNPGASQMTLNLGNSLFEDQYRLLISIETDSPSCGCGFTSVERIAIILGLDRIEDSTNLKQRQQFTPDMMFTCDGMITKWIIGANWFRLDDLYPELQLWRSSGDDVYRKINGTFIEINAQSNNQVYEYSNFEPIPFQVGDILGMFMPEDQLLRPLAEEERGPVNHYISVDDSATVSPHSTFDLQQRSVQSSVYHPLVSVEIIVKSPSSTPVEDPVSAFPTASVTPTPSVTSTAPLLQPSPTLPPSVSLPSPVPTQPDSEGDDTVTKVVYITVGVGGTLLVLIVTAVIVASVTACLHCRKSKSQLVNTTDNIAYGITQREVELQLSDRTYSSIKHTTDSTVYDYPANTSGSDNRIATFSNQAYALGQCNRGDNATARPTDWGNSRKN